MTELISALTICGFVAGSVILAGLYIYLMEKEDNDTRNFQKFLDSYIEHEQQKSN